MIADISMVFLVEDEFLQREMLVYNFKADGFHVVEVENGEEVLMLVEEMALDIILLDWMLSNVLGIEVCWRFKIWPEMWGVFIIMISARSEEVDCVCGLEMGADDYVIKFYLVIELMA